MEGANSKASLRQHNLDQVLRVYSKSAITQVLDHSQFYVPSVTLLTTKNSPSLWSLSLPERAG